MSLGAAKSSSAWHNISASQLRLVQKLQYYHVERNSQISHLSMMTDAFAAALDFGDMSFSDDASMKELSSDRESLSMIYTSNNLGLEEVRLKIFLGPRGPRLNLDHSECTEYHHAAGKPGLAH